MTVQPEHTLMEV